MAVTEKDLERWNSAKEEAERYVENDVQMDMDYYRWAKAKFKAEQEGNTFNEPEPKFDLNKNRFSGIDMINAFMRGYQYYEKLNKEEE